MVTVKKGEYITLNGRKFECIVDELELPKIITSSYLLNLWDENKLNLILD
jgi:hypothetical protein